ncbi:MAG: response regulator [Desulfuromonadales bacterium]|nr:response regulator [Desulfuromonadales bacterium]
MCKILAVDDCRWIRELMMVMLTRHGYSVTTACSGHEAISKFNEADYDLVITDICMPGVDGNALAQHIKSLTRSVPVIALTGSCELAGGAFDWVLVKPARKKELLNIIDELSAPKVQSKQPEIGLVEKSDSSLWGETLSAKWGC